MAAPYTQLSPAALPGRRYGSFAGKTDANTALGGLDYTLPSNIHKYTLGASQPNYTMPRNQPNYTIPENQPDFTLPNESGDFSV